MRKARASVQKRALRPAPWSPDRREALRARLDALLASYDRAHHLAADPVSFVHRYERPADREVAGLVAATLAFGNVVAIRASVGRALAALGPSPADAATSLDEAELAARLGGFVHRVYRGPHLARMLARAGALVREEGSLGAALASRVERAGELREGLALFADALRGARAPRGLCHLVPDPRAGSACKRLLLYLRWMARPSDGIDLGLFPLSPSLLLVPLDTHVHRIARNLGLTARADASWRTAEEVTSRLRELDPLDPVKYDFALCHLGVSRACPSRRDEVRCAECVLRPVCVVWRGKAQSQTIGATKMSSSPFRSLEK